MADNFTSAELEELAQLERTLMKVKKAFGGRTVVIKGNSIEVSEPGSDIVMEYSLKDVLRRIHKKERGNAGVNGRRATVRTNSRYSLATYGPSAARKKNKRKTKTLRNTARENADKAIAVKAMQDRLRALRRIEREKKKAERALAAGAGAAGAGAGAGAAGAGAGAGAVHSASLSRSRSSSGSNNVGELASMLNSMTVTEVKSEIAELEAALAKMGL